MRIFLGHELGFHHGCIDALDSGKCRTLAGSRYVLVDFPESVDFFELRAATEQLKHAGYIPVLAYTERYGCLFGRLDWIEEFMDGGGLVQLNASSFCGSWGKACQKQWKKLVRRGLVHIISTDGHNLGRRLPLMSVCLPFLQKHCDPLTLRQLTWDNACLVIRDEVI